MRLDHISRVTVRCGTAVQLSLCTLCHLREMFLAREPLMRVSNFNPTFSCPCTHFRFRAKWQEMGKTSSGLSLGLRLIVHNMTFIFETMYPSESKRRRKRRIFQDGFLTSTSHSPHLLLRKIQQQLKRRVQGKVQGL